MGFMMVYVLPGHSRQTPLSTYVLSYFPFSTRWMKPAFVYYFQQKLMEILLYQSSSQMKLELQFLQLMLTVHSSMDIFVLVCLKNTDLLPSVSVTNEILPIKAHLLDWSNKTQCYYIPIVNSIQHQSIYTSHVIYIVHIK